MNQQLHDLHRARVMLAACYVPWVANDGKGGHCAVGVVGKITVSLYSKEAGKLLNLLDATARRCHPELRGAVQARPPEFQFYSIVDVFDWDPVGYVNNHLGKEAILAVFDDAILHEELRELLAQEAVSEISREIDAHPITDAHVQPAER